MAKKTAVVEEDVELDELDDDVDADEAPKANEVTFGVGDICNYLNEKHGTKLKPRDLRTQIRRMAREKNPRVNREITAGNRTRYDWPDGLKDPEVKAIIKAVEAGELEAGKKEALQALKDRKNAQKAAGNGKKKGKKTKAVVVEDDDDLDEDDE
jgi:hypothetical protein